MPSKRISHESLISTHTHRSIDLGVGSDSQSPDKQIRRGSSNRPTSKQLRRLSESQNLSKTPFYQAASSAKGTSPALFFEAKYYGPCPEIPIDSNRPTGVNIVAIVQAKKEAGRNTAVNLYFCERGVAVMPKDKKSPVCIINWRTMHIESCATVKYPGRSGRRIGMLKARDPCTNTMVWHAFKYYASKKDHMSDCFRFVVDCSLRDIGRAVAEKAQQNAGNQRASSVRTSCNAPPPAWEEPDVIAPPPRYESANGPNRNNGSDSLSSTEYGKSERPSMSKQKPLRRSLQFDHIPGDTNDREAIAEAEDIARSEARYASVEFCNSLQMEESRARENESGYGYMMVAPVSTFEL